MKWSNIILLFYLLLSCYPLKKPSDIVPLGDEIIIYSHNNLIYQGELIAIIDTNIYVSQKTTAQNKIIPISIMEIKSIKIPGYGVDPSTRVAAALPSVIMQMIIFFVAKDNHVDSWVLITSISIPTTIILYAFSGRELKFKSPILKEDLEELRLYCRYPQELANEDWQVIFNQFK